MSDNRPLLKKLQNGKFREVDEYLSMLPQEELDEKLFYIGKDLLLRDDVGINQDGLKNLMHFYRKDLQALRDSL